MHPSPTAQYAAADAGLVVRRDGGAIALAPAAPAELAAYVSGPNLDALLAAGPEVWAAVHAWAAGLDGPLIPFDGLDLRVPFTVADYVDFYASEVHATTVGRLFRPDGDPLHPNWKHLPVSYHGRAGSVVVSGTPVRRPRGLLGPGRYGPTGRLDLEAELGFVVGGSLPLGETASTDALERLVFGVVGLNDWSARDIQAFETAPLGPHLGKSFATSISAWVTPLAALPRVPLGPQDPAPLPHLAPAGPTYDIAVEVRVDGAVVSRPSYADLYWSPGQMLAHLVSNGAGLRTGDLFGSGTISSAGEPGSLLELGSGADDAFLADGDEVVLRYTAGDLELGEVRGTVLPAHGD